MCLISMPFMMAADLNQAQLLLSPSSIFVPGPRSLSSSENNRNPFESRRSGSSSPSMSDSGLSTPSGSEVATDSSYEDDDYMAELTRQMAHRMLQEDDDDVNPSFLIPAWGLAGSPPSTLWSPFAANQSNKTASFPESDRAWDISHDLSDQFEKMARFDEQEPQNHNFHHNFYHPASLDITSSVRPSSQALSNGGIMANEYDRVQPERVAKQSGSKNRKKRGGNGESATATARTAPSPSTATHRQAQRQAFQRAGSGMRAVFLGGSGSGNGSSGTGVFLPRGAGNNPCEPPKKPRCSTVLIPARVAHALMAHHDKMGARSRPGVGYFPPQHDAATGGRSPGPYLQQKRQSEATPALNQSDIDLPQEWMY